MVDFPEISLVALRALQRNLMRSALTALGRTVARPVRRFGAVYVPNGIVMSNWTPQGEARGFELSPTLQPLAPYRDSFY